ncbi:hypothetical protein [Candidatus Nitrospira inopinata]|uniref:Uncharacterized protein n=1 Tax=Candidatus Nitrospira inopinata TaxID=1715989 RepID=A0A0S4KSN4_9BACT|nr:hypothetical protein [Candidatus Nitrospira inopinata]CUQ66313.1 conserved protein of unknown function [Candidatus Nitrospira inopinata]
MNEDISWPPVTDDEDLARFVLFRGWIRSSHSTVKPDAFIPYPYPDLSVTRHIGLSVEEVWQIGQAVADRRPATLYGRADIQAVHIRRQALRIVPTPEPRNHANITDWPKDKPAQKIIAQELAAVARYVPNPNQ